MNDPDFWSDKKQSDDAMREAKSLRARLEPVRSLEVRLADAEGLLVLAREEDDASVLADVARDLEAIEVVVAEQETATFLSQPDDERNAILTIHSGAGGTESSGSTPVRTPTCSTPLRARLGPRSSSTTARRRRSRTPRGRARTAFRSRAGS